MRKEKAWELLRRVANQVIANINEILPNAIIEGTPWVYERESGKPGEPAVDLITGTLEHYPWVDASAIDTPPHKIWSFDIQCPDHAIAIPDRNTPGFHILKPDGVSTLFLTLAQRLSQLIDVESNHPKRG